MLHAQKMGGIWNFNLCSKKREEKKSCREGKENRHQEDDRSRNCSFFPLSFSLSFFFTIEEDESKGRTSSEQVVFSLENLVKETEKLGENLNQTMQKRRENICLWLKCILSSSEPLMSSGKKSSMRMEEKQVKIDFHSFHHFTFTSLKIQTFSSQPSSSFSTFYDKMFAEEGKVASAISWRLSPPSPPPPPTEQLPFWWQKQEKRLDADEGGMKTCKSMTRVKMLDRSFLLWTIFVWISSLLQEKEILRKANITTFGR